MFFLLPIRRSSAERRWRLNKSQKDSKTDLILKDLGLAPNLFGFVFALGSIMGIIGGYLIHVLRNLTIKSYAMIDIVFLSSTFLVIGIGHSLTATIIALAFSMGWWRLRAILYQHHLLKLFKHSTYKATLISTYGFFVRCSEVWLPFVFILAITKLGYYHGYNIIAIAAIAIILPLIILAMKQFNLEKIGNES